MKIATFNINDINKRLANLLAWLADAKPDVVCLQELKSTDAAFPVDALRRAGYGAVWRGERSWNGVAILARDAEPVLIRNALPGDDADRQSRYIEAAVGGVVIASIYMPNGNPQPGPKFTYKLDWFDRFLDHSAALLHADVPAVLAGDYNVVPTDFDIYATRSFVNDALLQPAPRAAYADLIEMGWTDALREQHPDQPMFTFWSYLRNRWPRDAGLRLDHLLLSPALAPRLRSAGVDRQVRGEAGASDHAPAWIDLKPARQPTRRPR
jgi:exodeoxyribonuclease-3